MAKAPDLSNPAERRAYRRELMAYRRLTRLAGLGIVIVGVVMVFWPRISGRWVMVGGRPLQELGWIVVVAGWVVLIAVIVLRTRYHRRRMSGRT
jgi:uncharacterized membrane protein HdeD (DUF308 family)